MSMPSIMNCCCRLVLPWMNTLFEFISESFPPTSSLPTVSAGASLAIEKMSRAVGTVSSPSRDITVWFIAEVVSSRGGGARHGNRLGDFTDRQLQIGARGVVGVDSHPLLDHAPKALQF